MLVQITSYYFCTGLVVKDDIVVRAAPILKYMLYWSLGRSEEYCRKKGWKLLIILEN